ncbi:MAG: HNH endonuclease [Dermatophilaceae bacterium]|nr:HNH endonuclease [Intrasporangiaceae bacterium]
MLSDAEELALRHQAMAWLAVRTHDGQEAISREELRSFTFRDERLTLIDTGRGIRKPAISRGALTIMTVHRPEGQSRPYEDVTGPDGLPRYKYRADAGGKSENEAVRVAMREHWPLIWLVGVAPGWFQVVFPVFVLTEEKHLDQFVLAYDARQRLPLVESPAEEVLRRYVERETLQRVHQPVFRSMVLRAYETRCAVCALGHRQLLDAAHIVSDKEKQGVAAVRNGLALCKIHHAAYDAGILGITPEYRVAIRDDVLVEIDGPLLEHGLKGLHGHHLMTVPQRRGDRPDPSLLAWRYERFRSA